MIAALRPTRLRDDRPAGAPDHDAAPETLSVDDATSAYPVWRCAHCGAEITDPDDAIAVRGAHRHRCVNPAGIAFRIGCFARAPGCATGGEPTAEHSWFPPHQWCYAWCAACGVHLGWRFEDAGRPRFYGLIRDRLVLAGSNEPDSGAT